MTRIQELKLNIEKARAVLEEAKLELLKERVRQQRAEPSLRKKMAKLLTKI